MEPPKQILMEVSKKCNLNCKHCYLGQEKIKKDLSLTQWFQIMDKLSSMGAKKIVLLGGEPFLYGKDKNDFYSLLQYAIDSFEEVSVETNGTLPTELSDYKCKVAISFESCNQEQNDEIRGKVDFKGKKMSVYELASRKLNVITNTKFSRFSLYLFTKVLQSIMFAESKNANSVFVPLIPVRPELQSLVPNSNKLVEAFRTVFNYSPMFQYNHMIEYPQYYLYKLALEGQWNKFDIFRERGKVCPSGSYRLFIDAQGNVNPCSFIKGFRFGNILEDDISKINKGRVLYNRTVNSIPFSNKCAKCPDTIRQICMGGCCAVYLNANRPRMGINCPLPHMSEFQEAMLNCEIQEAYRR